MQGIICPGVRIAVCYIRTTPLRCNFNFHLLKNAIYHTVINLIVLGWIVRMARWLCASINLDISGSSHSVLHYQVTQYTLVFSSLFFLSLFFFISFFLPFFLLSSFLFFFFSFFLPFFFFPLSHHFEHALYKCCLACLMHTSSWGQGLILQNTVCCKM